MIEIIRRERNYTLLPLLSTRSMTAKERTGSLREFERPVPSRKISLVYRQARLKRGMLDAIAAQMIESLPPEGQLSKRQVKVISPGAGHFKPASP